MELGKFFKKLFGAAPEPEVSPVKPENGEKKFGDLEYELARRKAQQQREMGNPFSPHDDSQQSGGGPVS